MMDTPHSENGTLSEPEERVPGRPDTRFSGALVPGIGVACVVLIAIVVAALSLGTSVNSPEPDRPSIATAQSHALKAGSLSKSGSRSRPSTLTGTQNSLLQTSSPTKVPASSSSPTGYLYANPNEAVFVQWRSAGGTRISGSLRGSYIPAETTPAIVEPFNESLTGSQSGQKITMTLTTPIYGDKTLNGTFSNSVLVLSIPSTTGKIASQTFTPASVSTYDQQVNQLVWTAAAKNAPTAAEQQASAEIAQMNQQDVTADVGAVVADLATLSTDSNFASDLGGVASALSSANTDLSTAQSDAQSNPGECPNMSPVSTDVSSVISDAEGVGQSAQVVESDVQSVRGDLQGLQADVATLQSDEQADGLFPTNAPSSSTIKGAMAAAQSAISSAISTSNSAIQQASADATTALQLFVTANNAGNCNLPTPSGPSGMTAIS